MIYFMGNVGFSQQYIQMRSKENEPRFINGLKMAKNILMQLKAQKMEEMQLQEQRRSTPLKDLTHREQLNQQSESLGQDRKQDNVVQEETVKSKTQDLHSKINKIGQELFECHNQYENYQLVFQRLVEFYRGKLPVIEENQKLRRKKVELEEQIGIEQGKIKSRYEGMQEMRRSEEVMKEVLRQHLTTFLVGQAEKGSQKPHQKLNLNYLLNIKLRKIDNTQQNPPQNGMTLRYQTLKKQVARRPPQRKVQAQQQQLRRPLYQSQLYTL